MHMVTRRGVRVPVPSILEIGEKGKLALTTLRMAHNLQTFADGWHGG